MKTSELIDIIEKFAPLSEQEEWDNSGWQTGPFIDEVKKVLVVLDINDDTVEQAVQSGCDLILSHHPVFFSPIKSLPPSFITKAIKHNISIFSAHTNLDKATGGVNDCFAELCGFTDVVLFDEFVKYKQLDAPQDMKALISHLKSVFGIDKLKISNLNKAHFSSVAFCSGAGSEYIDILDENGIDVYLTSDVKYHNVQNLKRLTVIDIGHFNSERCAGRIFGKLLKNSPVEVIEGVEKDVFEYI